MKALPGCLLPPGINRDPKRRLRILSPRASRQKRPKAQGIQGSNRINEANFRNSGLTRLMQAK